MKGIALLCITGLLLIFGLMVAGCTSNQNSNQIDPNQKGTVQILQYDRLPYKGGYTLTVYAKNIGDNAVSGTFDYTKYTCDKIPILTKSGDFYNIKPGEPIKVVINLENVDKEYYDISCYWTLNAGQKITTTGEGPRVIPEMHNS